MAIYMFLSSFPLPQIDSPSKALHCLPLAASSRRTGPIINHLEGPLSTFSLPEEWTDIGPRRLLSHPFVPSLPGVRGGPPCIWLDPPPRDPASSQNLCPKLGWPWIMRWLKYEIQEITCYTPPSIAYCQASRSTPVADVHELCHITALCRVPKGYSIMRYAMRLLPGCYNSLSSWVMYQCFHRYCTVTVLVLPANVRQNPPLW